MKAIKRLSNKPFDMRLVNINSPKIQNDYVKVRVCYAGICGSDVKMFGYDCSHPLSKLKPPVIPGHESSGIVEEVGKDVKDISIGQRVVYHTMVDSCGICEYCLKGDYGMCKSRKGIGSTIDGAFAEYICVPAKNIIKIDDEIPLSVATLTEPVACSIKIVEDVANVRRGENVVIFGPGTIGACCAIIAKNNGSRVLVVGTKNSASKFKILKDIGIDCIVNTSNLKQDVLNYFGKDVDVCIEAAGNNKAFDDCLKVVKRKGKIILGAVRESDKKYLINMLKIFADQIKILPSCSTRPLNWLKSIEIIKNNCSSFSKIISRIYECDEWEKAMDDAYKRNVLKILIRFSGEE